MIFVPLIVKSRELEENPPKIPQFQQLRKKIYKEFIPNIELQFGYMDKENGQLQFVTAKATPVGRFPPKKYKKV